ncbi:MAG: DUF1109 domain-containing protein [Pseudomonadota bacterium]
MQTKDLITRLSQEAPAKSQLRSPVFFSAGLILILTIYGVGAQIFLGSRPDLVTQFTRPLFIAEISLLTILAMSSAIAAILAMYPDAYQKPGLLRLPYFVFAALLALLFFEVFMPDDARMITPPFSMAGRECSICIAMLSFLPACLIFGVLRRGASVHPLLAGSLAVMAAAGMGCLILRLFEPNDTLAHLVTWHYMATFVFACLGAIAGRWLLKW